MKIGSTKLLGVIISDDLKWDLNTDHIVKKANKRMELLRKVAKFSTSIEDKRTMYILYIINNLRISSIIYEYKNRYQT